MERKLCFGKNLSSQMEFRVLHCRHFQLYTHHSYLILTSHPLEYHNIYICIINFAIIFYVIYESNTGSVGVSICLLLESEMESFLAVRWNDENGTIRGRTQIEILPGNYAIIRDKGTLQIPTTKDIIKFYIKDVYTCKVEWENVK